MKEIDLHGYKITEAANYFIKFYNNMLASGSKESIRIIHGYGASGTGGGIKLKIRSILKANKSNFEYIAGEDIDGNPGYTIVYPKKRLSEVSASMTEPILDLCSIPKTQSTIISKFIRKNSEHEIVKAIQELERKGLLRTFYKNNKKYYVDSSIENIDIK